MNTDMIPDKYRPRLSEVLVSLENRMSFGRKPRWRLDHINRAVVIEDVAIMEILLRGPSDPELSNRVVDYIVQESDKIDEEMLSLDLDRGFPEPDDSPPERQRNGDWIQTYTGIMFYPADIEPDDICIDDIAHALALANRFAGHTKLPLSVAEHSVRVMRLIPREYPRLRLEALLHDASEAYLVDLPRPIKHMPTMQAYRDLEKYVDGKIRSKFGLPDKMSPEVKAADDVMLVTERRDCLGYSPIPWKIDAVPSPDMNVSLPWSHDKAEDKFLLAFYGLVEEIADLEFSE